MNYVTCTGISILAVGVLLSGVAQGQDYSLPAGVQPGQVSGDGEYRNLGRAAFTALKVGQGARATGMGDAYTAVSDDINALFWNPAGLTHIEHFEYTFGYTRWLVDSRFFIGGMAWRYGQQTLGLSVVQFDVGASPETTPMDPQGNKGGKVTAGDVFIKASYARKMTNKLSLAVSVKWIQETLHRDKIASASFDFSSLFYTGFGSSRLAMTLNNFGKDQELLIPGSLSEGAGCFLLCFSQLDLKVTNRSR